MRLHRVAGLTIALLVGLGVLTFTWFARQEPQRCFVPLIGFVVEAGHDPDAGPEQWIEEYWREPVELVSVEEQTDEQGRPERLVTWKSSTKKIKSSMSQHADGHWEGGLASGAC
jgi:hypothetical protein